MMYNKLLCKMFWNRVARSTKGIPAVSTTDLRTPVVAGRLQQVPAYSTSAGPREKSPVDGVDRPADAAPPHEGTKPLSLADVPGPKVRPFVGTITFKTFGMKLNEIVPFTRERTKEFVPHGLYKERFLGFDVVLLISAAAIEKFFRKEAKYPNRFPVPLWVDYQKNAGEEPGLFTAEGEQWHRMRSVVDKPMLRLKDVKSYTDDMNEVVTDLIARLERIRQEDNIVPDLEQEFFNWSVESIGTILYERRFGGLSDHRDPEMENFIKAVGQMFTLTVELFVFPIWLVKIIRRKKYKQHSEAWDVLFNTAKKCVDERMVEIARQREKGEEVHGVLAYLLAQESMTQREIYSNITELMMAAVDTTSNTMMWCLYEISQKPEIQEKIFAEVKECVGEAIPSYQDLQNMPYMKAVIKETLRMYPAAGSLSRITEEAVELCGYEIPAKTPISVTGYAVSRLPQYFDNPDTFVPERWLQDRSERPNPFTSLPFGIGTRMCVGRRVAELELHLLLSRLVQRYRIEAAFTEPIGIALRLLLKPDQPVRLKFINRRAD